MMKHVETCGNVRNFPSMTCDFAAQCALLCHYNWLLRGSLLEVLDVAVLVELEKGFRRHMSKLCFRDKSQLTILSGLGPAARCRSHSKHARWFQFWETACGIAWHSHLQVLCGRGAGNPFAWGARTES